MAPSNIADAVVAVHSAAGPGSGVVLAPTLVVTCAHVVGKHRRVKVGEIVADVEHIDTDCDLAVLRLTKPWPNPPLQLRGNVTEAALLAGDLQIHGHCDGPGHVPVSARPSVRADLWPSPVATPCRTASAVGRWCTPTFRSASDWPKLAAATSGMPR